MKHYKQYGVVFIDQTHRTSNPTQPTLTVYQFKHHLDQKGTINFDLDNRGNLIEEYSNPIAKIDWKDGGVKIQDKTAWGTIPAELRANITDELRKFWTAANNV